MPGAIGSNSRLSVTSSLFKWYFVNYQDPEVAAGDVGRKCCCQASPARSDHNDVVVVPIWS